LGSGSRGFFFAYHAVPNSLYAINAFRYHVNVAWLRALRRRSQRSAITWERFNGFIDRYIPKARVEHPWPEARFRVRHTQGGGWSR
jgi:RNA-directed DNA polymerase